MTDTNLPELCEVTLDECISRLPEKIRGEVMRPVISYFNNSPTAGRARGKRHLELNEDLLRQDTAEMLEQTLPHELAHLLVHQTCDYPTKPHGKEWRHFMALLGCAPDVCHRMEQPNLKRKRQSRHVYQCDCRSHDLTTTRHNKHIVDGQTFICRSCKGELIYTGVSKHE